MYQFASLQRGDVAASLAKYSEAFSLSPDDHLLTSNRSNAYFKVTTHTQLIR